MKLDGPFSFSIILSFEQSFSKSQRNVSNFAQNFRRNAKKKIKPSNPFLQILSYYISSKLLNIKYERLLLERRNEPVRAKIARKPLSPRSLTYKNVRNWHSAREGPVHAHAHTARLNRSLRRSSFRLPFSFFFLLLLLHLWQLING